MRGSAFVVFVLNLFLDEDSVQEWEAFGRRLLPIHLQRIGDQAEAIGFQGETPTVFAISARAAAAAGREGFGVPA
jgi:hypothetical protein